MYVDNLFQINLFVNSGGNQLFKQNYFATEKVKLKVDFFFLSVNLNLILFNLLNITTSFNFQGEYQ